MKLLSLALLPFLAFAPAASADEFTDVIAGALEAYEKGDITVAREELDYAMKLLTDLKAQSLAGFLPAALPGWTRTEADAEGGGMMHQFVVTDNPECAPVGVEDLVMEDDTMFLFPNPVGDELFMAGKSSITSIVRVVDIQGRTIKQQQLAAFEGQVSIDISSLKPGLYVVLWRNERGETARKLVVR